MTRLVLSVKSFTVCSTFHTACDIGDGLILLRRFFPQKRRLQPKFFVHHCLYAEVSLLSFSKREFHLAACAFEKTVSFRTQLSTYSRRFITSVEHENSGEHEISDLSTDLSLSLSTVYNLGPRARGYKPYSTRLSTVSCSSLDFTLCANSGEVIKHLEHEIVLSVEHEMLKS